MKHPVQHLGWFCPVILVAFFLANCSDQTDSAPTAMIEKVETSYVQGAYKFEGPTSRPKIETELPEDQKQFFFNKPSKLVGDYITNKKTYYPTGRLVYNGYDVGVFPMSGQCPAGYDQVAIFMDCEDGASVTKIEKGTDVTEDQYGITVDGNKNIWLQFCRVDGRKFKAFKQGNGAPLAYGLLKLGNIALTNGVYSHEIIRNFDNEDSGNKNTYIGDISPNIVNTNTTMRIEVIYSTSDVNNGDPYGNRGIPTDALGGARYGVFADSYIDPSGLRTNRGYKVTTDDEDNRNANSCTYDGSPYQNNSSVNSVSWLIANSNTTFNIVYPYFN